MGCQGSHRQPMKQHLLTAALLGLALALYGAGLSGGGDALLLLGGACELLFWVRVSPGFGVMSRKRDR